MWFGRLASFRDGPAARASRRARSPTAPRPPGATRSPSGTARSAAAASATAGPRPRQVRARPLVNILPRWVSFLKTTPRDVLQDIRLPSVMRSTATAPRSASSTPSRHSTAPHPPAPPAPAPTAHRELADGWTTTMRRRGFGPRWCGSGTRRRGGLGAALAGREAAAMVATKMRHGAEPVAEGQQRQMGGARQQRRRQKRRGKPVAVRSRPEPGPRRPIQPRPQPKEQSGRQLTQRTEKAAEPQQGKPQLELEAPARKGRAARPGPGRALGSVSRPSARRGCRRTRRRGIPSPRCWRSSRRSRGRPAVRMQPAQNRGSWTWAACGCVLHPCSVYTCAH